MKRNVFKISLLIFLFLVISAVISIYLLSYKDYTDYFNLRHGFLTGVVETKDSIEGKYWVTLSNSDGFKIDCGLLLPRNTGKQFPAIILLGGKATGKYAIDYTLDIDNVIILALDYPYEPRESYSFWTILQDVPAVRKALFDMVPAAMLATDYLFKRSDVDTTKIVVLGYSFGAPFVPVITAHDRRSSAAIMVYGGGELTSMIRYNVSRYESACMGEFVGRLAGLLLHPMEPMRFADKISPRPLVMINGVNDEQIPRYNTELFYNAAKEPKKIIWLESKHVNTKNIELTRRIIATLKKELVRLEIIKEMD